MHFVIIGCGGIAKTHAKVLKKLEDFVPGKPVRVSFASRNIEKAQEYKNTFKGDMVFGSYEEAIKHHDIDVLIICTPNDTHKKYAIMGLNNDKHIVIEKPITNTLDEADEILKLARKKKKQVLVAENHRYRPHIRYVERLIHSGELGVLKMIRMNIMRKHEFKSGEWRTSLKQNGGGPLIDGGIHWINALLTLGGGEADDIRSLEPLRTLPDCPQEDSMVVTCRLKNNAIGVLTYSWDIAGSIPYKFFSIHGTRGSIYVANTGMFGLKLTGKFPKPIWFPMKDWKGYEGMWQDFLISLGNDNAEHCLCTGEIGRRDLAFVLEAYETSQTKPAKRRVA